MTAQYMSQNLPKRSFRDFLSLRHPNHFVLAGANNRNVIITYRFLAAPVQANRDFSYFDCMTVYFNCKYLIYARVTRVPPRNFAFWAKSLRGQKVDSSLYFLRSLALKAIIDCFSLYQESIRGFWFSSEYVFLAFSQFEISILKRVCHEFYAAPWRHGVQTKARRKP